MHYMSLAIRSLNLSTHTSVSYSHQVKTIVKLIKGLLTGLIHGTFPRIDYQSYLPHPFWISGRGVILVRTSKVLLPTSADSSLINVLFTSSCRHPRDMYSFLMVTHISPKSSTNPLLYTGYELLTSFRYYGSVCACQE